MIPRKRIMFVFGTRPEAIKMAPIILELEKHADLLESVIAVTAQHREMLDQVLSIFKIRPHYDLSIMEKEQSISSIVVKSLQGLEEIMLRERPDVVLVQGDTTTTFVAGLAAYYQRIPLGHVEAGLRTYDKFRPFPEEMSRKLTSCLADLHFAPTRVAVDNLEKENIPRNQIYLTGNTVIDALLSVAKRNYDLKRLRINIPKNRKMVLATLHRRESFGKPLQNMCQAIKKIADKYLSQVNIVIPVHKNPLVQDTVKDILGEIPNVELTHPLDYEPFVHLMKASHFILTDSGGIQEEGPSLGKPVLVLREKTERPEAIFSGTAKLVGVSEEKIITETEKLLTDQDEYERMSKAINPYGDGHAAERIIAALLHYFGFTDKKPEEFIGG